METAQSVRYCNPDSNQNWEVRRILAGLPIQIWLKSIRRLLTNINLTVAHPATNYRHFTRPIIARELTTGLDGGPVASRNHIHATILYMYSLLYCVCISITHRTLKVTPLEVFRLKLCIGVSVHPVYYMPCPSHAHISDQSNIIWPFIRTAWSSVLSQCLSQEQILFSAGFKCCEMWRFMNARFRMARPPTTYYRYCCQ